MMASTWTKIPNAPTLSIFRYEPDDPPVVHLGIEVGERRVDDQHHRLQGVPKEPQHLVGPALLADLLERLMLAGLVGVDHLPALSEVLSEGVDVAQELLTDLGQVPGLHPEQDEEVAEIADLDAHERGTPSPRRRGSRAGPRRPPSHALGATSVGRRPWPS
jgi:hypothetical protein